VKIKRAEKDEARRSERGANSERKNELKNGKGQAARVLGLPRKNRKFCE